MNDKLFQLLMNILSKSSDTFNSHEAMRVLQEYQNNYRFKGVEDIKQNSIVRCKDCKFNVVSGCKRLKKSIRIYLEDGFVVSQWCKNNKYIPDPNFSCSFGQPKKIDTTDSFFDEPLHSLKTHSPKDMQKNDILDKLSHKIKGVGNCSTIAQEFNLMKEILTTIINILSVTYQNLMTEEKVE